MDAGHGDFDLRASAFFCGSTKMFCFQNKLLQIGGTEIEVQD
jgi:hypothetical protein